MMSARSPSSTGTWNADPSRARTSCTGVGVVGRTVDVHREPQRREAAHLGERRQQLVARDRAGDLGVAEDRAQLARREPRVGRHRDRARLVDRGVGDHPLEQPRAGQVQRDAVALADTERDQTAGEAVGLLLPLGEGDRCRRCRDRRTRSRRDEPRPSCAAGRRGAHPSRVTSRSPSWAGPAIGRRRARACWPAARRWSIVPRSRRCARGPSRSMRCSRSANTTNTCPLTSAASSPASHATTGAMLAGSHSSNSPGAASIPWSTVSVMRVRGTWRDRVHRDAVLLQLACQHDGHRRDAGLGRRVVDLSGESVEA